MVCLVIFISVSCQCVPFLVQLALLAKGLQDEQCTLVLTSRIYGSREMVRSTGHPGVILVSMFTFMAISLRTQNTYHIATSAIYVLEWLDPKLAHSSSKWTTSMCSIPTFAQNSPKMKMSSAKTIQTPKVVPGPMVDRSFHTRWLMIIIVNYLIKYTICILRMTPISQRPVASECSRRANRSSPLCGIEKWETWKLGNESSSGYASKPWYHRYPKIAG